MTTSSMTQADVGIDKKDGKREAWKRIYSARFLYLIIMPTFLLVFIFNYAPVLMGFYYSFTRFDGMHAFWIGLENYRRIFQDPALIQSYKNITILLVFSLAVGVTMPLFVAYLIYHLKKADTRYWFRVLFTVPMVVPGIVMLLIWIFMYTPSGGINIILQLIGLEQWTLTADGLPRAWLGDQKTALGAIMFMGFPWVSPVNMLILLAGLEAIPVELIDAAKVDGATGWKMFWFIELPMVVGQIRLIIVTGTIGVMQGFQNILVLTRGGPGYATMVPAMRMYDTALPENSLGVGSAPQMGFGAAIGVFLFVVIMVITLVNMRLVRSVEPEIVR
ncbi:MAG: sugar ABC transporter permease [Anaerolineae bacterium]|nr:sugar ABC transporter permease [Anaerolineae bacterium]